jgi:hypothetical protein
MQIFNKHWISLGLVLFFLLSGWEIYRYGDLILDPCDPKSDIALIETQIHFAKEGKERLGVYSRFLFHHPGPLQFYWSAFTEDLVFFTDNIFGKHQFSTWFLNHLFFLGFWISFLVLLKGEKHKFFFMGLFMAVFSGSFLASPHGLSYVIWNPANTIMPILCLLGMIPWIEKGKIWVLGLVPIVVQFAFQNHIGTAILISPILIWSACKIFKSRVLTGRQLVYYSIYFVIISCLLLTPAILEQWESETGNIGKLLVFVTKNGGFQKSLLKCYLFLGSFYTELFRGQGDSVPGFASFFVLSFVLGLIFQLKADFSPWKEWKQIFWIGFGITLYACLGMKGPLLKFGIWFFYTFLWISVLLLGKSILEWIQIRKGYSMSLRLGVFLGIFLWILAFWAVPSASVNPNICDSKDREFAAFFQINPDKESVQFDLPFNEEHGDRWPALTGIVHQLVVHNISVCVNSEWDFMFNENLNCEEKSKRVRRFAVRNQKNWSPTGINSPTDRESETNNPPRGSFLFGDTLIFEVLPLQD